MWEAAPAPPAHALLIVFPCCQICVVGPWPFGLLQQLHDCVKSFVEGVPGLIMHTNVLCWHCHVAWLPLDEVQHTARRGHSERCCSSQVPTVVRGVAVDGMELQQEHQNPRDGVLGVDMGTLGFATWTVELGTKRRQRAVRQAIQQAAATAAEAAWMEGLSPTALPQPEVATKAEADAQAAHACRIVEL